MSDTSYSIISIDDVIDAYIRFEASPHVSFTTEEANELILHFMSELTGISVDELVNKVLECTGQSVDSLISQM